MADWNPQPPSPLSFVSEGDQGCLRLWMKTTAGIVQSTMMRRIQLIRTSLGDLGSLVLWGTYILSYKRVIRESRRNSKR